MTIQTTRRFSAGLQGLRMKAFVVIGVWRGVKERAGEIGKLLARRMTTLALQIRWWRRRCRRTRAADDCTFIWSDWN